MWVSRKMSLNNKKENVAVLGDITSCSGETVIAQSNDEYRDIPVLTPFGIASIPEDGSKAVIIPLDNGAICAGTICEEDALSPGEIMLYSSGGASIVLKNNGEVLINGVSFDSLIES